MRGETADPTEDRDYVKSLTRGLDVIRAFSADRPAMTLTEVAERAGMNRAAARRFLLTLVKDGYAETQGRNFRLRPKVLELGRSVIPTMTFADIAQPLLDDLARELDETCYISLLDDQSVVYILRANGRRLIGVNLEVGTRMPAWLMSSGRVLAAALPADERKAWLSAVKLERLTDKTIRTKAILGRAMTQVASQGWCVVDEEYEIGMRSLSVPIRDRSGQVFAALNVTCPSSRVSVAMMHGIFLPALQTFAGHIAEAMPSDRIFAEIALAADPGPSIRLTPR
jgi:IclR family pca regulon transcriptional regulator